MRRLWTSRSRRTFAMALGGLAAVVAAALAITLAGGGSGRALVRHAQVDLRCHFGTVPADDPSKEGDGDQGASSGDAQPCQRLGGPETFRDLFTSSTELAARETAPFTQTAPGAYLHAVSQRRAMPAAGTLSGTGGKWKLAGHAPLCAAQTTGSKACPAASAENGNYSNVGGLGFRTLSGRISSYAFDPTHAGRYFASPVVGGVWETRNAGGSWHSIGNGLPTQTVGAIAYDVPLHRVIVGTGDNSFGGDGIAGIGIYYSSDDGATWHRARGVPEQILSFKVVVSPVGSSGKTVYAATSKGLFRSTDGGVSFHNENLPTSPPGYKPNCKGNTTSHLCFFANAVSDVIVKPTKTSNGPAGSVIAAVGWRAGQKIDVDAKGNPVSGCTLHGAKTDCLQAPRNGLYTSKTGQPGSFSYIPAGGGGVNLPPTPVFGRTALAVAHGPHQTSDAVYALVEDARKFNGCQDVLDTVPTGCNSVIQAYGAATVLDGMYASYDFGKSWTKIMDYTQLKQPGTNSSIGDQVGYNPGIQAWYNLWVEADPTATNAATGDPTRVLFGLEEVWQNNPRPGIGALPLTTPFATQPPDSWAVVGRYWNACAVGPVAISIGPCNPNPFTGGPIPGSTTHPDQHASALIPDGKGGVTLLIGSDGGAFSQHAAKGQNFSNNGWGNGLNTTMSALQPYDAGMAKDGTIVSGLQDNGEMKISPNGNESEIFGGDGFYTTINPNNSKQIWEEYTYGQPSLTVDGGNSWYGITPGDCGASDTALFATPIEQDPTIPGHLLVGCTQIQEATHAFADPCTTPDGGNANNCAVVNVPFNTVYDLSTLPSPNGAPNIPSALAVRGANEYVAYCGYCDPATQKIPFANGIATNVGGSKPPKIGTSNGWHKAKGLCSDCHTANGKLPQRYINSIQEDPNNPNTVYVTLGGYGRRWIPPGSFGESVANVGVGHVFVSHDHGDHFTNITGNLPDVSANWTAVHDGKLIVATDLGVFIQKSGGTAASRRGGPTYAVLGKGLPAAPVFTLRVAPGNANKLLISTYGRSDWTYTFTKTSGGHKPGGGHHHPGGHGPGGPTNQHHCRKGTHRVTRTVHGKKVTSCKRNRSRSRSHHKHPSHKPRKSRGFTG
ncbi:MAG: WD40/YVTN/BNR-like repeat-containing protein [Solirubrobacteraceae bacterium]